MQLLAFSFGFKDAIDIILVAAMLYYTYRLLRRTGAANLFWGILAFILVWFLVSFVFQLDLTGALFDRIISVGAIALIIIFQEEIRMFFYRIGSRFSSFKIFRAAFVHRNSADMIIAVAALRDDVHLIDGLSAALANRSVKILWQSTTSVIHVQPFKKLLF